MERRATIQSVRRARWERQRREAIMREQIEHCYKAHTTAQAAAKDKS